MKFDNQYLTYSEYQELGGTLQEMPFNVLELEARTNIDKYTFGRFKELKEKPHEVKVCEYNLINVINSYKMNESKDKSVLSESTDGYSVNYSQADETSSKAKISDIKATITSYLSQVKVDNTPCLFRGV